MCVSYSAVLPKHNFTPTPGQTYSCRQTYTPIHKLLQGCLLCWVQEWEELMWNVWFFFSFFLSGWLRRQYCRTYLCAQMKHVSYQRLLWETKSVSGNLGNLSHAAPLVPFLPAPVHPQAPCFVYTKTCGLDTLHSQRRKKTRLRYR